MKYKIELIIQSSYPFLQFLGYANMELLTAPLSFLVVFVTAWWE